MSGKSKKFLAIGKSISLVTQLAISFITPIFIGLYLVRKYTADNKTLSLIAILFGTLIGITSTFGLLSKVCQVSNKK